jgi:hypothetical protein
MKKLLFLALALVVFTIQACDDIEDYKKGKENLPEEMPETLPEKFTKVGVVTQAEIFNIEGNLSGNIQVLDFVARYHGFSAKSTGVSTDRTMMTVPFSKNYTLLHFPADPPQNLMRNITLDFPKGFRISDKAAQTIAFTEIAYCSDEHKTRVVGNFQQIKTNGVLRYEAEYIYCDRPVKVTGTARDWWHNRTSYNLSMHKGWNLVIRKEDHSDPNAMIVTISNDMPDGMVWFYNTWIGRR